MQKIILFNAPANSGKDYASDYLHKQYNTFQFSFKRKLIEIVKVIYNLSDEHVALLSHRLMKEMPSHLLGGKSWRETLIETSEKMVKPHLMRDYFGKQEAQNISLHCNSDVAVSSDCGFVEEVIPLITAFGGENIFIVHIEAEGCSFEGDSRSYIFHNSIPDDHHITIKNNKDNDFLLDLDWLYSHVINY